jgi:hypothetical protein
MIKEQITSSKTEFERFEQKRKYPRIILDNCASLLFPGNQTINVLLYDLSICAIQVRFDSQTEQAIRTVLEYLDAKELSTIKVRFKIKVQGSEEDVYVPCKPIYIYQMDQDIYAMGMLFADMEYRDQALISNFVEHSMEPH